MPINKNQRGGGNEKENTKAVLGDFLYLKFALSFCMACYGVWFIEVVENSK